MYQIIKKEKMNDVVELMVVKAPMVARKCEPGQFIILRVDDKGERIPLTIADYDREAETITIIYQIVGYSTQELAKLNEGDYILDFVGPLGIPTELKPHKRVLGIAGGVGSAPLFPQLRKLAEMGVEVDCIIGGRSTPYVLWENRMKEFCKNVYVATNDGSYGTQGFVTTVLNQLIAEGKEYDEVIAIGPVIMMKSVVDVTKPLNIPTMVSLNPVMVDGTGMCGGCRVTVGGKVKFACVDGPDFDGFEVDFDELMMRQKIFQKQEKHICNMTGEVR